MVYDPRKSREISIKGKQVTDAFHAGEQNERMQISRGTTNTGGERFNEFRRPAGGPGGYETVPFDDFGDYRGPTIPNPNRGLPGQGFDWAHHNPDQPDNILNHILYTPDGEMWGIQDAKTGEPRKITPADRKKIQQEQQKHQQSQKSMMISDTRNLQKGLPPTGGKFGNMINQQAESYRGIDNDKLIDLQRLAAPLLIKNV